MQLERPVIQLLLCRKPLQTEDMWDLPPGDKAKKVTSDFDINWQEELKRPKPSLVRIGISDPLTVCMLLPGRTGLPSAVTQDLGNDIAAGRLVECSLCLQLYVHRVASEAIPRHTWSIKLAAMSGLSLATRIGPYTQLNGSKMSSSDMTQGSSCLRIPSRKFSMCLWPI